MNSLLVIASHNEMECLSIRQVLMKEEQHFNWSMDWILSVFVKYGLLNDTVYQSSTLLIGLKREKKVEGT
jgi:hypothetical protein